MILNKQLSKIIKIVHAIFPNIKIPDKKILITKKFINNLK